MKQSTNSRPQTPVLTAEQDAIKQSRLPRAPDDLSDAARLLFEAAVNKIKFTPTESGGLIVDYSALTKEELFAVGISIFDPPSVRKKLRDIIWCRNEWRYLLRRKRYTVLMQPINPDLIAAERRLRETIRGEILVNARGQQFQIGRRKGARALIHQYLQGLYQRISPPTTFKEFWKAIEGEVERRAAVDGRIALAEIDGTTLRYLDSKGREMKIEKNTIRNHFSSYKNIRR